MEVTFFQALIAGVGITAQLAIASRSRSASAKQSVDTIENERWMSHRTTAAFIADKRQKWIDELRADVAFYLALSETIAWSWSAYHSRVFELHGERENALAQQVSPSQLWERFDNENGLKQREHQECHLRIELRLNPEEELPQSLLFVLKKIRALMEDFYAAKNHDEVQSLRFRMTELVTVARSQTNKILREEWKRVKQEVAYPELLLKSIPTPVE